MKTNERWSHLNFITECSALRAQAMCSGFSGHKFAGEAARPLSPATQAATAAARDGAAVDARARAAQPAAAADAKKAARPALWPWLPARRPAPVSAQRI